MLQLPLHAAHCTCNHGDTARCTVVAAALAGAALKAGTRTRL
jgi:hypothetical protein